MTNHHVIEWKCTNPGCKVKLRAKTKAGGSGSASHVECPACGTLQTHPLPNPPYEFSYNDGIGWKDLSS